MKDETLRAILFSRTVDLVMPESRTFSMDFPETDTEKERRLLIRSDDGLILHLIRRIEALEEKLNLKQSK